MSLTHFHIWLANFTGCVFCVQLHINLIHIQICLVNSMNISKISLLETSKCCLNQKLFFLGRWKDRALAYFINIVYQDELILGHTQKLLMSLCIYILKHLREKFKISSVWLCPKTFSQKNLTCVCVYVCIYIFFLTGIKTGIYSFITVEHIAQIQQ